ncbi:MAG TPA: YnbE family lipoprotein [Proteus sp.]|uniref:Lipoprotein n=1 Tax=Proteus hauseri ATCC 700826 TaxID=1354271 RepID=A0AAJ3LTG3_PROHU|nr:YnbE family lipoprotein [Proteus hauseri]OAT46556.1 putative lipoprotein [Proteus hauseri ATCC 700826]QAV24760.1 YnbE family lipoprotein [Proteus hauseri]HCH50087.1 YnbE family lipoprotein [Proteus sp. (in: enterobacteria)]
MKPLFLKKLFLLTILMMGISALTGCIRLEVATPDKPININMNVKIEHEINVKIDRQVEDLLKDNSAIF